MRILGIDPGLATTGWAIVDYSANGKVLTLIDYGIVGTKAGLDTPTRLVEINSDLQEIIDRFKPDISSIELLLFNNNAKTAMVVGEARGTILYTLKKNGLEIYQFTPPQIKSSITGSGNANKKQVQENVKRLCNLDNLPKPDDAADAVAIAVCCFDHLRMNNILKIQV